MRKLSLIVFSISLVISMLYPSQLLAQENVNPLDDSRSELDSEQNTHVEEEQTNETKHSDEKSEGVQEDTSNEPNKNDDNVVEDDEQDLGEDKSKEDLTTENEKQQSPKINQKKIDTLEENSFSTMSSNVKGISTSRVGQIKSSNVRIYKDPARSEEYSTAGSKYINQAFFIKLETTVNNKKYYILSTKPSSVEGTIGWVQADDVTTYSHKNLDNRKKTFYFKGKGVAYNRAWGGSQNIVLTSQDLNDLQYKKFEVNLTQAVGNNTWYRGTYAGSNGNIWIHSSHLTSKEETNISRVGQIGTLGVEIYEQIDERSSIVKANSTHLNRMYHIKKQIKIDGQTFYLISTEPSSSRGLIGWINSKNILTYTHVGVDKNTKIFYLKGQGVAYNKIWGGSQNLVFNNKDLANREGYGLQVDLTEKVGNNIWYRGKVDGQTIWIHSSHVSSETGNATSKLGKIKGNNVPISRNLGDSSSIVSAGSTYTGMVYYIKRETVLHGKEYYLISNQPSSTSGTIGWVEKKDLDTYTHVGIDAKIKTFYLKGQGVAYNRPWGGAKNTVYNNNELNDLLGEPFQVHLTQKVGNNTWYRGLLKGKTVWIHGSHLSTSPVHKYTQYNLSLSNARDIQMKATPQTTNNYDTYVSRQYINNKNEVTADVLNVRGGPKTDYWVVGQLKKGNKVKILGTTGNWYKIEYTKNHQFVNASPDDTLYYLNPKHFINDARQKFQFLDLTRPSGASASVLNNYLNRKGTLSGQGQAFIDAGRQHGINDIYLISHAILETGHGTSALAQGIRYNGKTVYNLFGIGAYDSCPVECGAKKAYDEDWTSPYKAIVGGAQFIGNSYVKAGQNTLYKMRWNPEAMATNRTIGRQYATDIGWAYKQVGTMYNLYNEIGDYTLHLDIPVYH